MDRSRAIALLIGPLVLGRLSTLPDFDYRECALAAVDGFLRPVRPGQGGEGRIRRCLTAEFCSGRDLRHTVQVALSRVLRLVGHTTSVQTGASGPIL